MNRKELIAKYSENYLEQKFYSKNVMYAFSKEQIQDAIKKLGAKEEHELTSIFGIGDICLQSKKKEIIEWINRQTKEKEKWLQSLAKEEKEVIIRYELTNHECGYTRDIAPVLTKLKDVFTNNLIINVWQKARKESRD